MNETKKKVEGTGEKSRDFGQHTLDMPLEMKNNRIQWIIGRHGWQVTHSSTTLLMICVDLLSAKKSSCELLPNTEQR